MTRCVCTHTSGLLIKGVCVNDLVKFVMTLIGLKVCGRLERPEESIFEICKTRQNEKWHQEKRFTQLHPPTQHVYGVPMMCVIKTKVLEQASMRRKSAHFCLISGGCGGQIRYIDLWEFTASLPLERWAYWAHRHPLALPGQPDVDGSESLPLTDTQILLKVMCVRPV